MKRLALIFICFLTYAGVAIGQQFYTPMPQGFIYDPSQGEDQHIFNLNPASNATTGFKGGAYGLRHFRETSFTANDDSKTLTRAQAKEDIYGIAAMTDLGAGMAAGISVERNFAQSIMSRSTATMNARDLMVQQSVNGRVSIDLATGLRVGFIMRYVSLGADMAGTFFGSGDKYRVRYHGNMIGNGAGLVFSSGPYSLGASYSAAIRGKSEIVFEERIIADPGMALANFAYKFGAHSFGIGIQRWIHRRDERATTVTSQDGQRTLALNGLDPEKNVFPIVAYHVGVEVALTPAAMLRASVVRKDSDYISDLTTSPTTTKGYENMREQDYHLAVRLVRVPHDVMVGAIRYGRSKTLTNISGNAGALYHTSGNGIFLSWGAKL